MKPRWVQGNLVIQKAVLATVHGEAVAAYGRDEECCGLLAGPSEEWAAVDEAVPLVNRANKLHALDPEAYPRTGRMYFDIDPLRFKREVEARAAQGRPVKVLYHSHLDVGAYFSETDAAATMAGGAEPTYDLVYLVVSVRQHQVDDTKLFAWDPATKTFVNAPFEVR